MIHALRNLSWIDAATRVLMLELTLYSPESNLVCATRMVMTVSPSGNVEPVIVKEAFRIDFYHGWAGRGRIALDLFLFLSVLVFVVADIYSSFSKSHENGHANWYTCVPPAPLDTYAVLHIVLRSAVCLSSCTRAPRPRPACRLNAAACTATVTLHHGGQSLRPSPLPLTSRTTT